MKYSTGMICRIAGLLLVVAVTGCSRGVKPKDCSKPQEYQASNEAERFTVPDDLDRPGQQARLGVPEAEGLGAPQSPDTTCLDSPPDYFGLGAAVIVADSVGADSADADPATVVTQAIFLDERAREWNLSLNALYLNSQSSSGDNGSSIDIADDWGLGFLVGFNFTNHLALGFEMNFIKPRYDLTLVPDEPNPTPVNVSEKLTMFNGLLTGTYNLLEGPVTPFLDLSAGWTHLDSNVSDRPPFTGCWWDPWWGYICQTFWSTYTDTSFSYGGALGVRWDISSTLYMRASYNMLQLDGGTDPILDIGRIEIGWRR